VPGKKVPVIAAVQELTGLGLAEAKAIVDYLPSTVLAQQSHPIANAAKERLERPGTLVRLDGL
jgi:ribosomal protein L7/L12